MRLMEGPGLEKGRTKLHSAKDASDALSESGESPLLVRIEKTLRFRGILFTPSHTIR